MSTLDATFVPVKFARTFRPLVLLAIFLLLVPVIAPISTPPLRASSGKSPTDSPPAKPAKADYGKLPLSFEANHGQMNGQVQFLARNTGYRLYLTPTEAVMSLGQKQQRSTLRMKLRGANPQAAVRGQEPLPGVSNYFLGNNPNQWRTNVPHFARVKYEQVYPGVDMVYYSKDRQLEYDFIVAPGVNPDVIQMTVTGATEMRLDGNGDLVLRTAVGEVRQHKPVIYQHVNGTRQEVAGNFVLSHQNRVSFALGAYDHSRELVIDPSIGFSTYLGGFSDDKSYAIAVTGCSSGDCDTLVTGETAATDFPPGSGYSYQSDQTGTDAFIAKLDSTGTSLTFASYLGGNGTDIGYGIKVDGSGNIYAAGGTSSTDFPTNNGVQTSAQGSNDAFLVKLNSSGTTLSYGTYLGGSNHEDAFGLALSGSNAYMVGRTSSSASSFPETSGCAQSTLGGGFDAFFAKIDTTSSGGSSLLYLTYLGGSTTDEGKAIAVDGDGDAYLTGFAQSTDFPVTASPYQGSRSGLQDAFAAKISPGGNGSSDKSYVTYIGGNGRDGGWGIAVDTNEKAYVTGDTATGFPTTSGVIRTTETSGTDVFVTKFAANGQSLDYSTYLGGNGDETGYAITLDGSNNAFVTGETTSTDFDVTSDRTQQSSGGGTDVFVAKINSTATNLLFSTYHGGSNTDSGRGIAVSSGTAYFAGFTDTSEAAGNPFPIVPDANQMTPAYQYYLGGGVDAFVAKITGL